MTDSIETQVDPQSRSRKLPLAWLILTGILLLLLYITYFVGKARVSSTEARYKSALMESATRKGDAVAASIRLINPQLLSDDGQRAAQAYFAGIMKDPDIAYLVILDQQGQVRATSDLRFLREPAQPVSDLGGKTRGRTPADGANTEMMGPITDIDGKQIGAVRVGISYQAILR